MGLLMCLAGSVIDNGGVGSDTVGRIGRDR